MSSRLQSLPVGVDRQLFDGLQYNDLINTILEFSKYYNREMRKFLGLEDYMRDRVIHDFIGYDLYRDLNGNVRAGDLIEKYGRIIRVNNHILHFILLLINNDDFAIDPFILYTFLSNIYKQININYPGEVNIPFYIDHHEIYYIINSIAMTLEQMKHYGMTYQDVNNIINAFINMNEFSDFQIMKNLFGFSIPFQVIPSQFSSDIKDVVHIYYQLTKKIIENTSDDAFVEIIKLIKQYENEDIYQQFLNTLRLDPKLKDSIQWDNLYNIKLM